MAFTISQIADKIKGVVVGDGSLEVHGFAPLDCAKAGDLSFADNDAYIAAAGQSHATAIIVSANSSVSSDKVLIKVANPRIAAARLMPLFYPPETYTPALHPTATVAATAQIDTSAYIGPNCVVEHGAIIGARSVLMAGNYVGPNCKLGEDVRLFPNVVIYADCQLGNRVSIHSGTVIGSDGYGYVFDEGKHRKVLQIGNVVIEDDVEIGANAAIDRAALGSTRIGKGSKIDNLVHVAHNVVFGNHCLVMGQSGFAGSTKLGDYCVIASQSGIAGHLKLGNQATVGAKSGVMRDIPEKGVVLGIPAMPDKQAKRQIIGLMQLPELIKRTRDLEKQVEELKSRLG